MIISLCVISPSMSKYALFKKNFLPFLYILRSNNAGAHREFFCMVGGGGLTMRLYIIYLWFKNYVTKSRRKHNITLSTTVFIYVQT
jgi:hypothetical protein